MAGNIARLVSIGNVADAAQVRAVRYRDQAAQLLRVAATEPVGGMRQRLVDLANEYHQMAATIERTAPCPETGEAH
jgi:hypothetical protein